MRNLFITLFLSLTILSCNGQSSKQASKENSKKEVTTKKNKVKTIKLNKAEFLAKVVNYETTPNEWKYLGDKPAIIDFYADWCGPCRMVAPILEELAEEYSGKIYIYKIDTEKEQELASFFGIRSIPSLLFIPMTEQPQMAMGALPKADLKRAIEEVLLK
jgi:thioredoxin